eukprot:TRINITY_DN4965_c0_g1_i2.p1 TRINITY_DN4965_c0_g1~~TRINITY_DN4965_c0_g1_i2.p1  ORF type:complete len:216 (+),score=49.61 TRINITY_DN4965_c0_g1_i2:26-673(+)
MSLNILGHKTWHVWKKDNIDKVLKDEREHEEKMQKIKAEQAYRERERRYQLLKDKKEGKRTDSQSHSHDGDDLPLEHVNFFKDIEIYENESSVVNPKKTVEAHPEVLQEELEKKKREDRYTTNYLGITAIQNRQIKSNPEQNKYALERQERNIKARDPLNELKSMLPSEFDDKRSSKKRERSPSPNRKHKKRKKAKSMKIRCITDRIKEIREEID